MRLPGVNIGDMDKKFIVEMNTPSNNAVTSEQVQNWSTFTSVWGRFLRSTDKVVEANQNVALDKSNCMIRWTNGINETMRLNDNGTYYYIKGIDTLDRNVTMLLRVEKRNNV